MLGSSFFRPHSPSLSFSQIMSAHTSSEPGRNPTRILSPYLTWTENSINLIVFRLMRREHWFLVS
ncbi:hypothetical protein MtrunA17_Chr8g0344781 [Medicago truncatula]|uniref:Uncharacterized protein n=1 Tax=Medicago truncatula TaxID=3880 RepID=A0A396GGH6_MEDTR|nr:hypothetical protein MtrunA17_Chr8g0344781 [Medicago truncatula]